jgi:hypothetical protein
VPRQSPRCYTQVSLDPIHLAWLVNKFEWLARMTSIFRDPIRLVRMVNEFSGGEPASLRSAFELDDGQVVDDVAGPGARGGGCPDVSKGVGKPGNRAARGGLFHNQFLVAS